MSMVSLARRLRRLLHLNGLSTKAAFGALPEARARKILGETTIDDFGLRGPATVAPP